MPRVDPLPRSGVPRISSPPDIDKENRHVFRKTSCEV